MFRILVSVLTAALMLSAYGWSSRFDLSVLAADDNASSVTQESRLPETADGPGPTSETEVQAPEPENPDGRVPLDERRLNSRVSLSYLVVSLSNILNNRDRLNITQVCQAIRANLDQSPDSLDPAVVELLSNIFRNFSPHKISLEQIELLEKIYDQKITDSLEASYKTGRTGQDGPLSYFGSAVKESLTPYSDYYTGEQEYRNLLKPEVWTLTDDEVIEFNVSAAGFLARAWRLLDGYVRPGEKKLIPTAVLSYNKLFESSSPGFILTGLINLENEMGIYPPYWFYRGYYHLIADQPGETEECFRKFEAMWRPVIVKDPMCSDAAKFLMLFSLNRGDTEVAKRYAELVIKYSDPNNWLNIALAGVVYDELGESKKAEAAFQTNIDNGRGILASSLALDKLKQGEKAGIGIREYTEMQLKTHDLKEVDVIRDFAEKGNFIAQFCLGFMFQNGEGVIEDRREALNWYRLSAEQGYASAQLALAVKYHAGDGTPQDAQEAAKWYALAAAQGLVAAKTNLGLMYLVGAGVTLDMAEGVNLIREAADLGDPQAEFALGGLYFTGRGLPQNTDQGLKWCRLAAVKGYADAQYELGEFYLKGQYLDQDPTEAAKWLLLASDQNQLVAQNALAQMYYEGRGVEKDPAEAVRRFRQAAEQGYVKAQTNLGLMYRDGQGVTRDNAEAMSWYLKAAEQGDAEAQFFLGQMFEAGEGAAENQAEAVKWYQKAADQGYSQAQARLRSIK
ncbi:MAG: SEL1-like repeat protein [Deltaproteobacteria bacterium]|jgi:TPR repeat protein|nr:SEL1-like repeat protein [Deltaproteobacteria bacterium]